MELKGLYLNNIETAPPLGTWKDALNILVDSSGTAIKHETGFLDNVTFEGNAVSAFYTPHGILIFTEKDGLSMIYIYYGENDIKLVVKDRCFNFRQHRLMDLAYVVNGEGDLIVAFTDGVETPKLVNITKADPNVELYGELAQKYELFPRLTLPSISKVETISGGRLPVGTYCITICGLDETHTEYNWTPLTAPITIDSVRRTDIQPIGNNLVKDNTRSHLALNIKIKVVSSLIKFIKIGFAVNTNGVVKAYTSKEYFVNNSISSFNIIDTDDMDLASITDFINPKALYKSVAHLATSNITNKLYLAGLTTYNTFNYQPFANDIKIQWSLNKVIGINPTAGGKNTYKVGETLMYDKSFMPSGIFAFYITLYLKGGGIYGRYHIPGREANPGDKEKIEKPIDITKRESDDCLLDDKVFKYQVRDTSTLVHKKEYEGYGEMGYWENMDETYPDDFPDSNEGKVLRNTPVRHHRFPSIGALVNYGFKYIYVPQDINLTITGEIDMLILNSATTYGIITVVEGAFSKYLSKLDHAYKIEIGINQVFTLNPGDILIEDCYLTYIKYDPNGVIISTETELIGSVNEINETGNPRDINFISGFLINGELQEGYYISVEIDNLKFNYDYKLLFLSSDFYLPDAYYYATPLGLQVSNVIFPKELEGIVDRFEISYATPDFVDTNVIANGYFTNLDNFDPLEYRGHPIDILAANPNIEPTYFNMEGEIVEETISSQTRIKLVPISSKYTNSTTTALGLIRKITEARNLPALNKLAGNENRENSYKMKSLIYYDHDRDKVFLATICMFRRNAYLDFVNKTIVSTGRVYNFQYKEGFPEKYIFNGGYLVMSPHHYNSYVKDATELNSNMEYVWAVYNGNFRLKGESNIQDPWYTATELSSPDFTKYKEQGNYYKFREDTQSVNKYYQSEIYSPYRENITTIKNMIAESEAFDTGGVTMNWRKFNPLSTYILPSLKGDIVALRVSGKLLYISCQKALFAASIKDVLQTESGNTFLTKGDFFDRPPTEVVPSDMGTIGNTSKSATQITTEGLVTVDRENAAIYLIGDSIKEITTPAVKDGLKVLLKPNKPNFINNNDLAYIDEPTLRGGVSIADDPFNKRFIITINNSTWYDLKPTDTAIGNSDTIVMGSCIISCKYYVELQLSNRKHFRLLLKNAANPNGIPIEVYAMKHPSGGIPDSITYDGRHNDVRDAVIMAEAIKNGINTYLLAKGLDEDFQCYRLGMEVIIKPILFTSSIEVINVYINNTISYINTPNRVINKHVVLYSYSYAFSYFVARHKYSNDNYTIHSTRNGILKLVNLENSTNASLSNNKDKNIPDNQKSFIDFIFNMGGSNPARLQNVAFNATYSIESSVFNPANTYGVTSIALYTLNQCSGDIELTPNNIKQLHGFYYFNDIYDKLITQNIPFIIDGEFNKDILDGNEVSELIPNMLYITSDLNNGDYIQYNGKTYNMNGVVFKAVSGNTTFASSGSATVKTYKPWQTVSKIFSKVFVVRFTLANEGDGINTITNVNINFKPTRTTYAEIKNSGN